MQSITITVKTITITIALKHPQKENKTYSSGLMLVFSDEMQYERMQ